MDEHQPGGARVNLKSVGTFELFWASGYDSFAVCEDLQPVDSDLLSAWINGNVKPATHSFLFVDSKAGLGTIGLAARESRQAWLS